MHDRDDDVRGTRCGLSVQTFRTNGEFRTTLRSPSEVNELVDV
jgi:hypothetical protein